MKIAYNRVNFSGSSLQIIDHAIAILEEYAIRTIIVTLRQLYYQFVARDLIANKQSESNASERLSTMRASRA